MTSPTGPGLLQHLLAILQHIIPEIIRDEFRRIALNGVSPAPFENFPIRVMYVVGGWVGLTRDLAIHIGFGGLDDSFGVFLAGVGEDLHGGGALDADLLEEVEAEGEDVVRVGFGEVA